MIHALHINKKLIMIQALVATDQKEFLAKRGMDQHCESNQLEINIMTNHT